MRKASRRSRHCALSAPQRTAVSVERPATATQTSPSRQRSPHIEFPFPPAASITPSRKSCRIHHEANLHDTRFTMRAGYRTACGTGRTDGERITRAARRATTADVYAVLWRMYLSPCIFAVVEILMLTSLGSVIALNRPSQPHRARQRTLHVHAPMKRSRQACNSVWRRVVH